MSLILGIIVREQINIDNQHAIINQILTEIKHYLTLQRCILVDENQYCLQISSIRNCQQQQTQPQHSYLNTFILPKNFHYLFTHWQRINIDNQEDLEFFDICYQCLMIIKEYLPTKISIAVQIIDDLHNQTGFGTETDPLSLNQFLENFQSQKNQQFCRRINSNFKTLLTIHQTQINRFEIENILHLCQHFYFYKNKLAALKFIAQHKNVQKRDLAELDDKYIEFLNEICVDEDFRTYSAQILEKIELAREIIMNNQMNILHQNYTEELSSTSNIAEQHDNNQQMKSINKNKRNQTKNQKQLRSSSNQSNSENSNLLELNNRQPLKPFNKSNKIYQQNGTMFKKEDKLQKISPKSILFQLRQSQSLKRLTMLINTASQINFSDPKIQHKIDKEIENVCTNFLKLNYSKPNDQIAQQVTKFYQSLQKYFTKKGFLIKNIKSGNMKNTNHTEEHGNKKNPQWNHRQLLSRVCEKIENQLYINFQK